jgi:hypothetical protein
MRNVSKIQGDTGNYGGGFFASGRKKAFEPRKHRNTPGATEKPWADWK